MDAILGTAGHIDHGKTTLVRALTGINCDRLDEEKKRGITIELGFAWLDLPDKRRLGIIDVPGHERFVKNMVAGASGIDCMMLVIAADEGVMPQTREHLDICSLLGVKSGLVALTKVDMVDADWIEMVKEDIAASLKGSFLEGAPILPVSSATGEGLDNLRSAIFSLVSSLGRRSGTDILRLPVDRVFTLKGHGTVVTGTLVSGDCQQGEDLRLLPTNLPVKARSLQVHGNQVKEAHSGQRCAMNLLGAEVADIQRGDIVARPETLFPSKRWIAKIMCLPSAPLPIRQRMEVHFHHGSRECAAKIVLRDREELLPGESALAELHFSEPLPGIFGDRCVMRAHSPLRAIAGGVVANPLPPLLRKKDPQYQNKLDNLSRLGEVAEKRDGKPEDLPALALSLCPMPGASFKQLAVLTGLAAKELKAALEKLEADGEIIHWDAESDSWIAKEAFAAALESVKQRAEELHKREPLKISFARDAFLGGWAEKLPAKFTQKIIDSALKAEILSQAANGLKLAEREFELDSAQSEKISQIFAAYGKGAMAPPLVREICEEMGIEAKEAIGLIGHLCDTGKLVKIQEGLYYSKAALDEALAKAQAWFASNETLDIGDMKTIYGISRKFAIPLLEYMDAIRLTTRVGNSRKLARKA